MSKKMLSRKFNLVPEEINLTHAPQCVDCQNNKGALLCVAFGEVPKKYKENKKKCPKLLQKK